MRLFEQRVALFLIQIVVKHIPAAAAALLVVQRHIGPAEQLVVVARNAVGDGHAHRHRQGEPLEIALERLMNAVDERARVNRALHAQQKLVAAHAGHHVLAAHTFLQTLGEVLQHAIAELMAVRVVGLLEEVQIAQRQHVAVAMAVALALGTQALGDHLAGERPVHHLGQRIVIGFELQVDQLGRLSSISMSLPMGPR